MVSYQGFQTADIRLRMRNSEAIMHPDPASQVGQSQQAARTVEFIACNALHVRRTGGNQISDLACTELHLAEQIRLLFIIQPE